MVFADRIGAGKKLAKLLIKYRSKDTLIYALPRGGVIVAAEASKKIHAPLDLIIVRKIGHPLSPEYAICAVSESKNLICNKDETAQIDPRWLEEEIEKEYQEAQRRHQLYLSNQKPISAQEKTAVIIDDGIATGLTMETAIAEVKKQQPKKIIVAVPIAAKEIADFLANRVDEFIALDTPCDFAGSVGSYYAYFPQVTDEEVIRLIKKYNQQ